MNKEYELKSKEKDLIKKRKKHNMKEEAFEPKTTQLEKMQYFQLVLGNKMERIEIKEYKQIIYYLSGGRRRREEGEGRRKEGAGRREEEGGRRERLKLMLILDTTSIRTMVVCLIQAMSPM